MFREVELAFVTLTNTFATNPAGDDEFEQSTPNPLPKRIRNKYLKLISAGGIERFLTLSLVCCESRGEIMRVLRSMNSGSDVPKL